jgi:hypothetical protein
MAKIRKKASAPEPLIAPQVGDKVIPARSEMVYEILRVHDGGDEVDLHVTGTNLHRFRERIDNLTFVERKLPARTSNPFTNPEPTLDAGEVLERIRTVERDNLQRLQDDVTILTKYLKTQGASKAVLDVIEGLGNEQQKSWKATVDRIAKLLEE